MTSTCNDSRTTEQTTINVDSEMINTATQLSDNYSTKQLGLLMSVYNPPHLLDYVETKRHRRDLTFRNMSCMGVFQLIMELNCIATPSYSGSSASG